MLESRSHAGEMLGDHFRAFARRPYRFTRSGSVLESVTRDDIVVSGGTDDDAGAIVPELLARGVRAIDPRRATGSTIRRSTA